MNWLRRDKEEERLIELLKNSKQDFRFDRKDAKQRLLMSLDKPYEKELPLGRALWASYASALAVMLLVAAGGATLAYADQAGPGDPLFPLDKFAEKTILVIPMPAANKAQVQANIVAERLTELERIAPEEDRPETEAIIESQASLSEAVDAVSTAKARMADRGREKTVEKLETVLGRLEDLADKQETRATEIKDRTSDKKKKAEIEQQIEKIKKAKEKARAEREEKSELEQELKEEQERSDD